jgi:hypothetical protein
MHRGAEFPGSAPKIRGRTNFLTDCGSIAAGAILALYIPSIQDWVNLLTFINKASQKKSHF